MEEVGSSSSRMEAIPFDPRRRLVSLEEIKEHSPSRRDGIAWRPESTLRRFSAYLIRQLGKILRLPAKTTATASVLCHKFFLLQSFARNDPKIIAPACMFLAGKVEDTPCRLVKVVNFSYALVHWHAPEALLLIQGNQELHESRKRSILLAERLVLATLDFNLEILHPQHILKDCVMKLAIASIERKQALVQVTWNYANDGHLTTLCLQFTAKQIVGGYIFLGLKFLNLKLQDGSGSFWRRTFDVTPHQLEVICNQLLMFYEDAKRRRELRERAAAEATAANEARAHEPNPSSSKGKEVVGSASAGGGTSGEAAAQILVPLPEEVQAHQPNPSSSKGKEKWKEVHK